MGVAGGPDLIQDGLVLALDASDRNSYVSGSTTWFDLSGLNNSGSLINGPTFNTGSLGSIVFDGVDDYVVLTSTTSVIDWYTNNYTLQCLFFIGSSYTSTTNTGSPLIGNADPNSGIEYWSFGPTFSGKVQWYFWSGAINRFISNATLSLNTAYNITFTKNSNIMSIYINGILDSTTTLSVTPQSSLSYPLVIGGVATGRFIGRVASTQIYNKALTAQEILQNYNATKTRFGL